MSAQPDFDPEEDIRPRLRVLEGGGQSTSPRANLSAVPDSDDSEQSNAGGLTVIQGGGETTPGSRGHLSAVPDNGTNNSDRSLADRENDQVGDKGYTGSAKPSPIKRSGSVRKRASIAGIIVGLTTGTLTIGGLLAGPLEFLHFAESIRVPHFSATENFTDSRLGRIFVYARTGSIGDTRLDWVQRQYKGRILASMEKIGIKPVTDTRLNQGTGFDYLKSWQLDTTVTGSPIEGMSPEKVSSWAQSKLGIAQKDILVRPNGKVYIRTSNIITQTKVTYNISRELGKSRLSSAVRTRVLGKFFDFTLHPLEQKINRWVVDKTSESFNKWKTARETALKKGVVAATIDTTTATETTVDADGKSTQTPVEGTARETVTTSGAKNALTDFMKSPGGRVTGGLLMGAGVVCAAKTIADNSTEFKYVQVVQPLIRVGMEAISLADQIKDGADVDMTQLDYMAEQLVTRDENGQIVDDWSMAASIQSNNGGSGGIQLDESTKSGLEPGPPDWLEWTQDNPAVDGICSVPGQIAAGVVGVALSVVSGGAITTLVGTVTTALATNELIDRASAWVSGDAAPIATGAQKGAQADTGLALAGNAQAMQFAGNTLSDTQVAELNQQTADYERATFQSKSLVARVFDVKDRYSFASQIIDSHVFDAQNTIASLQGILSSPLKSFGSLFSNVFSSTQAFAATPAYDYGFPTLGFSLADQSNPLIENPIENADYVGNLLNTDPKDYIERAETCYDVSIFRGNEGWDVKSTASASAFERIYVSDGSQDEVCNTPSSEDPDWLRIRAFIADTASIESWACTEGDNTSCANSGFGGSTSNSSSDSTSNSSIDVASITQSSENISCATGTNDLGVQDGYSNGSPVRIRVCAIPGFASSAPESGTSGAYAIAGANGNVIVNSRVSGAWLALFNAAKADGITLSAGSSFRSMAHQQALCNANIGCRSGTSYKLVGRPGYSNHQLAVAIDMNGMHATGGSSCSTRARATPSTGWTWLNNNAARFGIKQYAAEAWHWDPMPLSYNCGGDGS